MAETTRALTRGLFDHAFHSRFERTLFAQVMPPTTATCTAHRLIDEWGAIDTNDTVLVNSTLCGVFPADFCPDGELAGRVHCLVVKRATGWLH